MDVYNRSVCNINKWTCKIILSRPCRVMQGEREKDMYREMNYSSLMRFDHGEYRVEKGACFGVKVVWSNLSKQKYIEKAKEMAQAAG